MRPILAAAALAALAAGCVRLLPAPAPPPLIYPMRAMVTPQTEAPPLPVVIGVARPNVAQASAGLDIVWAQDGRIAYLPRSVWEARVPDTVQGLFVETIDLQDYVLAAVQQGEGPRSDYDIRFDLHAFQVEEPRWEGPRASFDASLKLVRARDRLVVGARQLTVTAPVADRSEAAGVEAMQRVAAEAAAEAGAWAAAMIREDLAASAQPSAASISR